MPNSEPVNAERQPSKKAHPLACIQTKKQPYDPSHPPKAHATKSMRAQVLAGVLRGVRPAGSFNVCIRPAFVGLILSFGLAKRAERRRVGLALAMRGRPSQGPARDGRARSALGLVSAPFRHPRPAVGAEDVAVGSAFRSAPPLPTSWRSMKLESRGLAIAWPALRCELTVLLVRQPDASASPFGRVHWTGRTYQA